MARYNIGDLFVVSLMHNDRYSFDTSCPEEVFTTKSEAIAVAEKQTAVLKTLPSYIEGRHGYIVESLSARLDIVCDQCRNEGQYGSDR